MADETGTEYEGWSNYPTWAVNLWLSNDEGLYNEARERVADQVDAQDRLRETMTKPVWTPEESHRFAVADMLKDWVTDDLTELSPETSLMVGDLLGWALDSVDWYEIADAWLEDVVTA